MRRKDRELLPVLRVSRPGCHPQQCDAGCHEGRAVRCRCPCRGINHGVGFNQAVENTGECIEWLRELLHERRCGERTEMVRMNAQPLLYEVPARR